MSRHTITLTDHRGVKVRTTTGYQYYVVIPNGEGKAKVIRRSHSPIPIATELTRWDNTIAYEVVTRDGVTEAIRIPQDSMERRAAARKRSDNQRTREAARWGRGY